MTVFAEGLDMVTGLEFGGWARRHLGGAGAGTALFFQMPIAMISRMGQPKSFSMVGAFRAHTKRSIHLFGVPVVCFTGATVSLVSCTLARQTHQINTALLWTEISGDFILSRGVLT